MKTKVHAIIVAAGKGNRMRGSVRKQYIALDGIPILGRTLNIFDSCSKVNQIIVVVPHEDLDFCRNEILTPAKLQKDVNLIIIITELRLKVIEAGRLLKLNN